MVQQPHIDEYHKKKQKKKKNKNKTKNKKQNKNMDLHVYHPCKNPISKKKI